MNPSEFQIAITNVCVCVCIMACDWWKIVPGGSFWRCNQTNINYTLLTPWATQIGNRSSQAPVNFAFSQPSTARLTFRPFTPSVIQPLICFSLSSLPALLSDWFIKKKTTPALRNLKTWTAADLMGFTSSVFARLLTGWKHQHERHRPPGSW